MRRPFGRRLVLATAGVCLGMFCAAAGSVAIAGAATPGTPATPATPAMPGGHSGVVSGVFTPVVTAPATAEVVTVGTYLVNTYDVDFQSNTRYLTAYVWPTWKGDTDPTRSLEFANAVEEWGLVTTAVYDEPKKLPDGSNYQNMRINGRCYQPYDLLRYPLDRQRIALYLEDSSRPIDEVVCVPDRRMTPRSSPGFGVWTYRQRADLADLDPRRLGELRGTYLQGQREAGSWRLSRQRDGDHRTRALVEDVGAQDEDGRSSSATATMKPSFSGCVQ